MEGGVRGSATEDLAVGHQTMWRSAGGVMAQQAQTDIVARRTVVPRKVSWSEPYGPPGIRTEGLPAAERRWRRSRDDVGRLPQRFGNGDA